MGDWIEEVGLPPCPGRYCGRDLSHMDQTVDQLADLNATAALQVPCGACPRGSRTDGFLCKPCDGPLDTYGILFLLIMVMLTLVFHLNAVKAAALSGGGQQPQRTWKPLRSLPRRFLPSTLCFFEVATAVIVSLLFIEPQGSLRMYSCGMERVADWYPALSNPTPDCTTKLRCANEAAFPLQTFYLFFLLANLALFPIRAFIFYHLYRSKALTIIYRLLYTLPALALTHVVLGGLLYYVFPYALLAIAIVNTVVELARNFKMLSSLYVFVIQYLGFTLGMAAIAVFFDLTDGKHWAWVTLCGILPVLLYKLTEPFTDPDRA